MINRVFLHRSIIFIIFISIVVHLPGNTLQSQNENNSNYKGIKCSFNFVDADLTHVLFFFAKRFKLNMIISPHIKGKVTVKLKDVPWDQALTLICRQHGLAMEWMGKTGLSINRINSVKKKAI